ncbi:MAG: putative amidophosphoribosyltransferase [Candidatus Azotimanducaceae bacterium]|jgi:predicted amidophosphoribosyltransferase
MKQTLRIFLEILFPMREDARIVARTDHADIQKLYTQNITGEIVWLLPFSNAVVRASIHEIKFHENQKAAELLGAIIDRYVYAREQDTIIIPIPLSKERKKKRGHNQIVSILSYAKNAHIEKNMLHKKIDTAPQTTLTRKERLKNVVGA